MAVTDKNVVAEIYADLAKRTVSPKEVRCVQYDADVKVIAVHLLENGNTWEVPEGYSANVRMTKSDGAEIYNSAQVEDSTVYITLTEQMCGVVGTQYFCVEIINGEDAAYTGTVALDVSYNPLQRTDFTSLSQYGTLDQAVKDAQAAAQQAEDAAQNVVDENLANYYTKPEADNLFAPMEVYGVRFTSSANTGSTVSRLYGAVGKVAGVGTDTTTATNDFDSIYPWSARRRCCGNWNENGEFVVNAYEGEPGYAVDGSNGEVWVEHSLWYYKHTVSGNTEEVLISPRQYAGFSPAPIFLSQGGQRAPYQKAYTAAYPIAMVDGKPTSRSGVYPTGQSLNAVMTSAKSLGDGYCVTTAGEWYTEWLYMVVEFGTRNIQSVMRGDVQRSWSENVVALETAQSTNQVTISASLAGGFVVGSPIGIGTNLGGNQVCSNRIINSIQTSGENAIISFDGAAVAITAGNIVYSLAYRNGECNGVQASSGSKTSNTDWLHPCMYRGKENPYGGGNEWCSDVLFQRSGEEGSYAYAAYYLPDPAKYNAGTITEDYELLGYFLPTADGYSTALGLDERFPWVRIPSSVGGSETTYYADYYQYPHTSVAAGRLGGGWTSGGDAGPACWNCWNAPSSSGAYCLARLSFHRS